MKFKNVFLEEEEASKWGTYFVKNYPDHKIRLGQMVRWTGMTINTEQTIFVKVAHVNREDPHDIDLFYFWHGYLFSVKARQIWGENGLETWDLKYLIAYPTLDYVNILNLSEELTQFQEQILQDFKAAMIVYGRKGIGVAGYEKLDPPLPHIQIRVEGKVY